MFLCLPLPLSKNKKKKELKKKNPALALDSGWLSWLESYPLHQKVASLIPGQDTY